MELVSREYIPSESVHHGHGLRMREIESSLPSLGEAALHLAQRQLEYARVRAFDLWKNFVDIK